MKKLFLIALFSLGTHITYAQQNNRVSANQVPEAVKKAYLSQNSQGKNDTLWQTETVTIYKIKHYEENREYIWEYNADGNWLRTYTIIDMVELPLLVANQIQTMYPEYVITGAMIELSNNGKLYVVQLQRGQTKMKEQFLMNGKLFR